MFLKVETLDDSMDCRSSRSARLDLLALDSHGVVDDLEKTAQFALPNAQRPKTLTFVAITHSSISTIRFLPLISKPMLISHSFSSPSSPWTFPFPFPFHCPFRPPLFPLAGGAWKCGVSFVR